MLRNLCRAGLPVVAAFLALIAPQRAKADLPGTEFTYQGFLEFGGVPAEGLYDFQFELFDVNTGGSITSISTHTAIDVIHGHFTIPDVDFGEDVDIAMTDAELEVRVRQNGGGFYVALAPRQSFSAAPLASNLRGFTVEKGNLSELQMKTYRGDNVTAQWGTRLSGSGVLKLWASPLISNVATAVLDADIDHNPVNDVAEGVLKLRSVGANGDGGRIEVRDNTNGTTIELNGGNVNPTLTMTGSADSITFDLTQSGDDSVQLPDDAVHSSEILNEAGVASNKVSDIAHTFSTPGTLSVITSHRIDCPDTGFVLVIATCQLTARHAQGTNSHFDFGVSDDAGALPSNQDVAIMIPATEPDGIRAYAVTVHGLFFASPGENYFALLGRQNEGPVSEVYDTQLTLVYFPKAYGGVAGTLTGPDDGLDDAGASTSVPTVGPGPQAGRAASVVSEAARRDRELEQIRRELAELRARIERRSPLNEASAPDKEEPHVPADAGTKRVSHSTPAS